MADAEIHYRLNLILRLVDTTTGRKIKENRVIFKKENETLALMRKEEGIYLLVNYPGGDLVLDISAKGYLPTQTRICFEELPAKLPEIEVPLIPLTDRNQFTDYLTLEGQKPGLTSVAAVSFTNPHGVLISYQPRRQSIKMYYTKDFEERSYAVLHEETEKFEEFRVSRKLDKMEIRLAAPLLDACEPKEKIARIVRGRVEPDGHYLLRVLEEGEKTEYLVRYIVDGVESFERVVFGKKETPPETEEERS